MDIPEIQARIPLEVRAVSGEELRSFRLAFEEVGLSWDSVEPRLSRGDFCSIGLCEGRVVHFRWITTKGAWIPEVRGTILPNPGDAYVYGAFTVEDARGHNVQPAVSRFMVKWGRQQGYRCHVFYVVARNSSGLKIVGKIGARKTAVVRCFHFSHPKGSLITGLGGPESPRVEFGTDATVHRLGRLGVWVREGPGSREAGP